MCIKNLYNQLEDSEIPDFLKEKIEKSNELTGGAFFLKVFSSSKITSEVYYEQFYKKVFYGGSVDIKLKELVRLRLAGISGCKYCISVDENSALNNGVTEKEIFDAKHGNIENFSGIENNLLKLSEHIALNPPSERADIKLISKILEIISQEEFIEISFVIAILSGMGNMLGSLDLVETD
jgi:AhpD family alkylhydroperoxidase|tara:strand:+ start:7323 stop:7862 length:540 start_codon:yes stop_codon:yes gene_type:complete